jgi:hypothetical protein
MKAFCALFVDKNKKNISGLKIVVDFPEILNWQGFQPA